MGFDPDASDAETLIGDGLRWNDTLGLHDGGDRRIWINTKNRSTWREALLHEVLHAVDHHSGANAGESVVTAFAPVLLDVLGGNPDLVSFLIGEGSSRSSTGRRAPSK